MLHGIYHNRLDANTSRNRIEYSEINRDRYHYTVVEIAPREVQLFQVTEQTTTHGGSVIMEILNHDTERHTDVKFTNVPMERIHAAIALLNDEPRTGDFTRTELFTDGDMTSLSCQECGALCTIEGQETHVSWHNKLLP